MPASLQLRVSQAETPQAEGLAADATGLLEAAMCAVCGAAGAWGCSPGHKGCSLGTGGCSLVLSHMVTAWVRGGCAYVQPEHAWCHRCAVCEAAAEVPPPEELGRGQQGQASPSPPW